MDNIEAETFKLNQSLPFSLIASKLPWLAEFMMTQEKFKYFTLYTNRLNFKLLMSDRRSVTLLFSEAAFREHSSKLTSDDFEVRSTPKIISREVSAQPRILKKQWLLFEIF